MVKNEDYLEPFELYAPKDSERRYYFLGKVGEFLERYRPKKAIDYVVQITLGPAGYILWKSPPGFHRTINQILKHAGKLVALRSPQTGLAINLTHFISELMYGIKQKDWKRATAGLKGMHHTARELGSKDLEKLTHSALAEMAT